MQPERLRHLPPGIDVEPADVLYLARAEVGGRVQVFPVRGASVTMEHPEKQLARIDPRQPMAWLYHATRGALVRPLCQPGAAAIGPTPTAAIAAAMAVLAEYEAALAERLQR